MTTDVHQRFKNSIVTGCVPAILADIEQLFTALKERQKRLKHGLCNYLIGDLLSIILFYKEKLNYFNLNTIFS